MEAMVGPPVAENILHLVLSVPQTVPLHPGFVSSQQDVWSHIVSPKTLGKVFDRILTDLATARVIQDAREAPFSEALSDQMDCALPDPGLLAQVGFPLLHLHLILTFSRFEEILSFWIFKELFDFNKLLVLNLGFW